MSGIEALEFLDSGSLAKRPPRCFHCGVEFGLGEVVAFATFSPEEEVPYEPEDFLLCMACLTEHSYRFVAAAFLCFLRGGDV